MGIPNRQIGYSQKAILLNYISKQLEQLTGVVSKSNVSSLGQWYLHDSYSPALGPGWITFPDHATQTGSLDPNLVGQNVPGTAVQIYINPIDATGTDYTQQLLQLVGNFCILVLNQGANTVTYATTPQSFEVGAYENNIYADWTFNQSVEGSITIPGLSLANFNTVDPISIQAFIVASSEVWNFVSASNLTFPTDQSGYTLYTGGWTNVDDGNATDPVSYAGTFYTNGVADTQFYLSTNGYIYGVNNSLYLQGNQQDLYLTAGEALLDGDVQNFWYKNEVIGNKWKTSVLVYCGHCCGTPAQQTPYSYILNIYKDATTQYIETRVKTLDGGQSTGAAGPNGPWSVQSSTASQVWSSTDNGANWTYLGYGTVQ